jgi:ABC-type amino acid transport system permease subunit
MKRWQTLRRVVIPQAIRIVIPPTGNEFITLLKLTSLASVISVHELLTAAQEQASVSFKFAEVYGAALVYYLVIVSVLMFLQSKLERRFTWTSRARGRVVAVPTVAHDAR